MPHFWKCPLCGARPQASEKHCPRCHLKQDSDTYRELLAADQAGEIARRGTGWALIRQEKLVTVKGVFDPRKINDPPQPVEQLVSLTGIKNRFFKFWKRLTGRYPKSVNHWVRDGAGAGT